MKTRTQQGFTLIELLVVITIIAILASLAVPTFAKIQEKGNMTKGISNVKQIITTLKIYSSDNNSTYPTGADSNVAFRELFKKGVTESEAIFGCPGSEYGLFDGNIGTSPDYAEALKTKENHWAMTDGLTDSASGAYPLIWEISKSGGWDPTWDASAAGKIIKGRTWSSGKIILGQNDGSAAAVSCESSKGDQKLKMAGTTNLFSAAAAGSSTPPKVLDPS